MTQSRSTLSALLFVACCFVVWVGYFARVHFFKQSMATSLTFRVEPRPPPRPRVNIVAPVVNGVVQRPLVGETMESLIKPAGCGTVKDILVVLWARGDRPEFYFTPDSFGMPTNVNRYCKKACVRYVSSMDRRKISQADIVVFNFDFFDGHSTRMPPRPRPDVVYVYTSVENTNMKGRPSWDQFNFFWSYHTTLRLRTSWLTLTNLTYDRIIRPPRVSFEKRFKVPLSSLITRCNDPIGRWKFLREIMKLIPVHSYGACFRNTQVKGGYPKLAEQNGIPLLSFYKFHLLIENSLCTDHVSEKFSRAINVSTIPLVASKDSLPPYDLLQPTGNFLINVMKFKTVKEVADEVMKISADKKLFESYMAYKYMRVEDFNSGFRAMMEDRGEKAALCAIAEEMKTKEGRLKLAQRKITLNETCAPGDVVGQHFGLT